MTKRLKTPKSEIPAYAKNAAAGRRNPNSIDNTTSLLYRADLYRLLSHLFMKEVTLEIMEEMDKSGFINEMEAQRYDILNGIHQAQSSRLKAEPSNNQQSTISNQNLTFKNNIIENLALEYASLFIVPGKKVSPYESVHREDDPKGGRLWGDTTVKVKKFIEHHGLEFKGNAYHGIPDHIGIELEFFSRLLKKEAELRKQGKEEDAKHCLKVQFAFYKDHLNNWIPDFCEKVMAASSLDFYREIARLTRDLLKSEEERLIVNS